MRMRLLSPREGVAHGTSRQRTRPRRLWAAPPGAAQKPLNARNPRKERLRRDLAEGQASKPGFSQRAAGFGYISGLRQRLSHTYKRSEERRVGKECRSRWS